MIAAFLGTGTHCLECFRRISRSEVVCDRD